eukprot:scaffold36392_cov30-Tisochrysis_lutea.AAC.3
MGTGALQAPPLRGAPGGCAPSARSRLGRRAPARAPQTGQGAEREAHGLRQAWQRQGRAPRCRRRKPLFDELFDDPLIKDSCGRLAIARPAGPKLEDLDGLVVPAHTRAEHGRAVELLGMAGSVAFELPSLVVGDFAEYSLQSVEGGVGRVAILLRNVKVDRLGVQCLETQLLQRCKQARRHAGEAQVVLEQVDQLEVRALHLGNDLLNCERLHVD